MAEKRIVRLDIVEGKPRTFVHDAKLENGLFLEIVGKVANAELGAEADYEAYQVQVANADTERGQLLFHASVENMYDERLMKQDFELEAGKPGRGYQLVMGDIVTIPAISSVIVGNKLTLGADGLLVVGGDMFVVEALEDIVAGDYVQKSMVVRVL